MSMKEMEAKNVVVIGHGLKGPGEGFFDIAYGMCSHGAAGMGRYLGEELIPQMTEDPGKRAYIVTDASHTWSRGVRFIVDEKYGNFWKEVLEEGKEKKGESYPFEVRKLELGEDVGLLCTDPYMREFDDLVGDWERAGVGALGPELAPSVFPGD